MKTLLAGLALALATTTMACGGKQAPATPAPPTCADAAANNEKVIVAMGQAEGQDMQAYAVAGRETFAQHCAADAWPQAIITCAAGAADADAMIACVDQLTPEQREAMGRTFESKIGGGGAPAAAPKPTDPCGGDE
jgi:hypothetical protein